MPVHDRPIPSGDGGWSLSSKTTFPVTLYGISEDEAAAIVSVAVYNDFRSAFALLAGIIIRPGFRWRELDEYLETWRPTYFAHRQTTGASLEAARLTALGSVTVRLDLGPALALMLEGEVLSGEITDMLVRTLSSGVHAFRAAEKGERFASGWLVSAIGDDRACPDCLSRDGQRFKNPHRPRVPFHIGCRCSLIEWDDDDEEE